VLVGVFRHIFTMSNFQSALVQFAYYGAYFSLAIPAAMINRRYGYKTGVLTGLGLATLGGLLFIPASNARLRCRSSSRCSCWPPACRSSRPRPTRS
jgi:fucose permease